MNWVATNTASTAFDVINKSYDNVGTNICIIKNSQFLLSLTTTNSITSTNVSGTFTNWSVAAGWHEQDYEWDGVRHCLDALTWQFFSPPLILQYNSADYESNNFFHLSDYLSVGDIAKLGFVVNTNFLIDSSYFLDFDADTTIANVESRWVTTTNTVLASYPNETPMALKSSSPIPFTGMAYTEVRELVLLAADSSVLADELVTNTVIFWSSCLPEPSVTYTGDETVWDYDTTNWAFNRTATLTYTYSDATPTNVVGYGVTLEAWRGKIDSCSQCTPLVSDLGVGLSAIRASSAIAFPYNIATNYTPLCDLYVQSKGVPDGLSVEQFVLTNGVVQLLNTNWVQSIVATNTSLVDPATVAPTVYYGSMNHCTRCRNEDLPAGDWAPYEFDQPTHECFNCSGGAGDNRKFGLIMGSRDFSGAFISTEPFTSNCTTTQEVLVGQYPFQCIAWSPSAFNTCESNFNDCYSACAGDPVCRSACYDTRYACEQSTAFTNLAIDVVTIMLPLCNDNHYLGDNTNMNFFLPSGQIMDESTTPHMPWTYYSQWNYRVNPPILDNFFYPFHADARPSVTNNNVLLYHTGPIFDGSEVGMFYDDQWGQGIWSKVETGGPPVAASAGVTGVVFRSFINNTVPWAGTTGPQGMTRGWGINDKAMIMKWDALPGGFTHRVLP